MRKTGFWGVALGAFFGGEDAEASFTASAGTSFGASVMMQCH